MIICDEKPSVSRAQILEKIKGVDAAYWATKVRLDQEMLDAAGIVLVQIGVLGFASFGFRTSTENRC